MSGKAPRPPGRRFRPPLAGGNIEAVVEEKRTNEGMPTRSAAAHEDVEPRPPRARRSAGVMWMVLALLVLVALGWALWAAFS